MSTQSIEVTIFCMYHEVNESFICLLEESGLLELQHINDQQYIPHTELPRLEKMIRLSQDLEVDVNGIEVIIHLLDKLETMQEELRVLKNKLGS